MTTPSAGPFEYGVFCKGDSIEGQEPCGLVALSKEQYLRQLSRPDSLWFCPNCGSTADWDDASTCMDESPEDPLDPDVVGDLGPGEPG